MRYLEQQCHPCFGSWMQFESLKFRTRRSVFFRAERLSEGQENDFSAFDALDSPSEVGFVCVIHAPATSFNVEAIRTALETCGIDDITIFPDLEGLSRTVDKKWKEEEKVLPHEGVVTRLGISRLHGIGVFAIRQIQKGARIFLRDVDEMSWIKKDELGTLSKRVQELYKDFAVLKDGRMDVHLALTA